MMPPQGMVSHSPISQHSSSESPSFSKSNNNLLSEANRNFLDDMYKKEKLMMESIDSNKKMKMANLKKIDKIAENLRFGVNPPSPGATNTKNFLDHFNQMTQKSIPNQLLLPPPSSPSSFPHSAPSFLSEKGGTSLEQMGSMSFSDPKKTSPGAPNTPTKIPNSKLFAKCFICNKLLSNQYNLRVHLETHQNMR